MMTLKEFLTQAKANIDTPEKWHRGEYSFAKDDGSVCYCAVGALHSVHLPIENRASLRVVQATNALVDALEAVGITHGHIPRFNDDPNTTHADVMALFDRAIASVDA